MKRRLSNKETEPAPAGDATPPVKLYVGLDVGARQTQCCMINARGKVIRESKVATHPAAVGGWMRKHGTSDIEHVVLETGSMSSWLLASERTAVLGPHGPWT